MNAEDKFVATILDDLSSGSMELPTLPEVALKVRQMVDDPAISPDKLAKMISTDAALSARLIQVSNSAFFKGLNPVENVRTAVVRLGGVCVRNVVASLVMRQIYQAKKMGAIKKDLLHLWVHGTRVAAISHVLAKRYTKLNPDEAMLAGLVHDIGTLPILNKAMKFPEILENRGLLYQVISKLHPAIGKLILEEWGFSSELVKVAAEHEMLSRNTVGDPDYVDVVMIANLHSYTGLAKSKFSEMDWNTIPAFNKLGLSPEESIKAMIEAQSEIAEVQKLITGKP